MKVKNFPILSSFFKYKIQEIFYFVASHKISYDNSFETIKQNIQLTSDNFYISHIKLILVTRKILKIGYNNSHDIAASPKSHPTNTDGRMKILINFGFHPPQ